MKWIWNVGAAAPNLFTISFQKSKLCMFCPSCQYWGGCLKFGQKIQGPFCSSIGHAAAMAPIDTTAPLPRLTHVLEQRSRGWMPNVLCELLGAGQSRNKWLLLKHSMCPVTACIIAYYDKLCWWSIHYFTLLHITFDIFACYYMLLQWSLLQCYYIF